MSRCHPITLLRWSISIVLGTYAAELLLSHLHHQAGVPPGVALIAVAEAIAALLFLLPPTVVAGGRALLGVLAAAALFHLLRGEAPSLAFLLYAAAIGAVLHDAGAVRPSAGSARP